MLKIPTAAFYCQKLIRNLQITKKKGMQMLKSIFSTLLTSGLCVTMLATASYGESAKLPSIGTHAFDGYCSVGEPFAKTVQIGGDTYELSGTTWTYGRETYFACPVLKIQGSADVAKALYFDDTSTTGRSQNAVVDAFCDLLKPGTNGFFWEFGLARGNRTGVILIRCKGTDTKDGRYLLLTPSEVTPARNPQVMQ
ncbi:hypothetical protein E3A20_17490, partial [Planctomyces bekefii]